MTLGVNTSNERNDNMRKFWNYIDEHVWAQWAFALAVVGAFFLAADVIYPLIHDGETWEAAFRAWATGGC